MTDYTIVLPHQVKSFTDVMIVALTVYREASNQPQEAKVAVAWTIRNRVEHPSWWGKDWFSVCTKKAQFTSMVPPDGLNDPNLKRYGGPSDQAWADSIKAAYDVMLANEPDNTAGATHYYDRRMDQDPPNWAAIYTHTANIGDFRFYKS